MSLAGACVALVRVRAPDAAFQGLRQLWSYRLRTTLALAGLVVGVASVVGSRTLIDAVERMMRASFDEMGGTQVGIVRGAFETWEHGVRRTFPKRYPLDATDAQALASAIPEIEAVCMSSGIPASFATPRAKLPTEFAMACAPTVLEIRHVPVVAGRMFTADEDLHQARVAVMFQKVAVELFGSIAEAVGQELQINGQRFRVLGVVRAGGSWPGMQRRVMIPFATGIGRMGVRPENAGIWIRIRRGATFDGLKDTIRGLLARRHPGAAPDNFQAWGPGRWQEESMRTVRVLGRILQVIAVLCLTAGGVGIMNVFLISVTERTMEIGLRMALGASRRAVLVQVLFEAVLLCALGGAVGLAAARGLAGLFAAVIERTASGDGPSGPVVIHLRAADAALGLAVSSAVALLFGSYPAWRAARLDPAESLRRD